MPEIEVEVSHSLLLNKGTKNERWIGARAVITRTVGPDKGEAPGIDEYVANEAEAINQALGKWLGQKAKAIEDGIITEYDERDGYATGGAPPPGFDEPRTSQLPPPPNPPQQPDNAPRPVATGEGLNLGLLAWAPKVAERVPGSHFYVKVTKAHRTFNEKGKPYVSFANEDVQFPVFKANPESKSYKNVFGDWMPPENPDEYWYWQQPQVMKIDVGQDEETGKTFVWMTAFMDLQALEESGALAP